MDIRRIQEFQPSEEIDQANEAKEASQPASVYEAQVFGLPQGDSIETAQNVSFTTVPQGTTLPNMGQMPNIAGGGTYGPEAALAMIMNYLGDQTSLSNIEQSLNDQATPDQILQFARDHHLSAEGYNNATIDQLKGFIDKGY